MALMSQIVASTTPVWEKTLVDNFFQGAPVLEYMRAHGKVNRDGGLTIREPIIQNATGVQFFKGLTSMAAADSQVLGAADYDWVFSRADATIPGDEDWKNASDAGKVKIWDAVIKTAGVTLANQWSDALFADGTTFTGADTQLMPTPFEAVADDTSTYTIGGMLSTDLATWTGNVNSPAAGAGQPLTLKDIELLILDCTEGKITPDLLAFSKAGYGMLWSLVTTNQRYVNAKDASVGFEHFKFGNAVVFFDSHILTTGGNYTGQRMFAINTDHYRFTCGEGMEFVTMDNPMPDQFGYSKRIYLAGNFTCNGRRYQGVLEDFTT